MSGTICLLCTVTFILMLSTVEAFLFSSKEFASWREQPIDCAWLPWKYTGCAKSENGTFRKVETRGKIHAEYGGKDCDPEPDSRISNVGCSETEFVTTEIYRSLGGTRKGSIRDDTTSKDTNEGTRGSHGYTSNGNGYSIERGRVPMIQETNHYRIVLDRLQQDDMQCTSRDFINEFGVKLFGRDCARSRTKRQTSPFAPGDESVEHRDILFMIDGSGSIGKGKFKQELEFVKVLAGKFCNQRKITPERTRVALTTFASDYSHSIKFKDHKTFRSFKKALDKVKILKGKTCLINALDSVRKEMFAASSGSRVQKGNANGEREADGVVVLVTDGCFNCFSGDYKLELRRQQQLFHDMGIFIMTFMINVGIGCEEKYQYLYDGSACFQGISFPTWQEFKNVTQTMKDSENCIDRWFVNKGTGDQGKCG